MKKISLCFILVSAILTASIQQNKAQKIAFDRYHNPQEINEILKKMQGENSAFTRLHKLSQSEGGTDVLMLQIQAEKKNRPAILVFANLEGIYPVSAEGALFLAEKLLAEKNRAYAWYIVPNGNPDAARHFFNNPQFEFTGDAGAVNYDRDEQNGEDGPDDLNKDGYITQMRVKSPEGNYIVNPDNPLLMKKADAAKNERGIYKLYPEGLDNDNDGKFNEDPTGGVNIGITFPHLFEAYKPEAGLFPGSQELTFQIMKFMDEHPEILMTVSLGGSDFCISPPESKRKSSYSADAISIPKRYAKRLGADPNKKYSMEEIKDMIQNILPPSVKATESMVVSMLGLGAVVNPRPEDLKYYKTLSKEYKKHLAKNGFNTKRFPPVPAKNGSFELYAYYHLGLHSFAVNVFTLPKPEKTDSSESQKKPSKDQALFEYYKNTDTPAFVEWESFKHPTLGTVEIGGKRPFAENNPPAGALDTLLAAQIPWLTELSKKLPELSLGEIKITDQGGGIYRADIYVKNKGYLPYPTAMGKKNKANPPVVITITGKNIKFLSGNERSTVEFIDGNASKKISRLIQTDRPGTIQISLESANAGKDSKTVDLK